MTHHTSKSGEISLSELLTVIKELPWQNEEQRQSMIHALGFNWEKAQLQSILSSKQAKIIDHNPYRQRRLQSPASKDYKGFSIPPAPEPVELPKNIINSELKELDTPPATATPPAWLQHENNFLKPAPPEAPIKRNNLFPYKTCRGVLSAALQVRSKGRDIDLPLLIRQAVKGVLPRELPRLTTVSLQRGCQLLLDYSDSMVPYWEDLNALAEQLQDLLGRERVSIYEFEQNPSTAKFWDLSGQSKDWTLDATRPVVVASDLGVAGQRRPSVTNDWLEFILHLEQSKVPLLFLNPWQDDYWPLNLGTHPIQMHWNPRTTATKVNQIVGEGHEIGR